MLREEQYTRGLAPSTVVPYSESVHGSIYFSRGMVPIPSPVDFLAICGLKATVEAFVRVCGLISYGVNCALPRESV